MVSRTAEYALRAAVLLGTAQAAQSAVAIAKFTQVPTSYLSKILRALGRAGLVTGRRGPQGGFTLTREPKEITILEIVRAVDPARPLDRCPLGRADHVDQLCPLHGMLAASQRAFEADLRSVTLQDLIDPRDQGCPFPGEPDSRPLTFRTPTSSGPS